MGKKISFMLTLILTLVMTACASSDYKFSDASDQAKNVGAAAVSIADEYLDGSIDAKTANERIVELDDIDTDGNLSNMSISSKVLNLRTSLSSIAFDVALAEIDGTATDERFDEILEIRNELAEGLGIDKR